jgi:biopolymer transport protein ExbB
MAAAGVLHYLQQGDAVTHAVAWLLLTMSVVSWCCLLIKTWMLLHARRQARGSLAAFWGAPDLAAGVAQLGRADGERVFAPLAEAALGAVGRSADAPRTLLTDVDHDERVLRALRHALRVSQRRLEGGHVLLASIGATAPFVGLLGTVWGIYHALVGIAASGHPMLGDVAGPVGEALIMTAFGLVVAIPAVVAYNVLGRLARGLGEDLDGFAHDLHATLRTRRD